MHIDLTGKTALVTASTAGTGLAAAIGLARAGSGTLKAVVFNRSCGATTGFSTQVSILPVAQSLSDEGGNTLVLDGTVPLTLAWRSDAALRLSGLGNARVYHRAQAVAGVSVGYEN